MAETSLASEEVSSLAFGSRAGTVNSMHDIPEVGQPPLGRDSKVDRPGPGEERQIVWEVLAQFWVDTWYDDEELERFAVRLANCRFSLEELDHIAYREVCGAFATFTIGVFVSFGMALPDWYYPEEEARQKVADWLDRPRILSFMNPIWVMGYFSARSFLRQDWRKLRSKVAERIREKPS